MENIKSGLNKELIMKQIDINEYLPKIMSELKKGILVNTKNGDKTNSMTIGWGQVGIEWGKMFFSIYVRHGRFTHEQIETTKEFTVSVPIERTPEVAKAIGYIGSRNGREIDKLSDMNLTLSDGKEVKSPGIKELPLTIECKVIYSQEQNNPMANKDYHTVYYGEIVNAYILEESDFGVNNSVINSETENEGKMSPKALWITLLSILLLLACGSYIYNKFIKTQTYSTVVREEMSTVYSNTGLIKDSRVEKFVNTNPKILDSVAITGIKESYSRVNGKQTIDAAITIQNKTDKPLNDIEVVINVLDKKGKIIDDIDSEDRTIEPNSDYTFNIQITDEKAARWELAEIKNEKEE